LKIRKLQQNNYTATMASAARRQIIGGGAPINKSRRRLRPQIGGTARYYLKRAIASIFPEPCIKAPPNQNNLNYY